MLCNINFVGAAGGKSGQLHCIRIYRLFSVFKSSRLLRRSCAYLIGHVLDEFPVDVPVFLPLFEVSGMP